MTTSTTDAVEPPYRVRLADIPQPRWLPVLYYGYVAITLPFAVWRCTVVNWNAWFGPLALVADLFAMCTFLLLLWQVRYPKVPVYRPVNIEDWVVDCIIPTHTEPVDIIEPTVLAALRIRGVRRVLVLGNRFRPEVREMALRLGATYQARNAIEFGKAGNLNAGLAHTDAEFVITLDADHLACPHLLERTLGYLDDPEVALVQTPQSFYNTDSFAFRRTRRGVWTEGLLFYRSVQPAKNKWNASFYVGTSAVIRRAALDDIGGFANGTVTEDIHTALRLHARGWRTVFVPEPVAFGLEAASLREYYSQRRRWAVGSLQLLLQNRDSPLRRPGLTIAQRLHYLHATMIHLTGLQRLIHLSLPALTLFTATAPVVIPYGQYSALFLGYAALSWGMTAVYARRAFHPVHSEAYNLASALAQLAALGGLLRRERRFRAANKLVKPGERTWVKPALWLMMLVSVAPAGYGTWLAVTGTRNGLVFNAVLWGSLNTVWIGSMLLFLIGYERRPVPGYETLTGPAKYEWVMAQGMDQLEAARARIGSADPGVRTSSLVGADIDDLMPQGNST